MVQQSSNSKAYGRCQRLLFAGGWIGSLCLLTGGAALAQTASEAVTVPSAEELLAPVLQDVPASTPVAEPLPAAESPEVPSVSVELEQSTPAPEPELQPGAGPLTAPADSSRSDVLVAPDLVDAAQAAFEGESYIDPTPYSLGATDDPSVVVSERSTGCQMVLEPGQSVPSSVCPIAETSEGSGWVGSLGSDSFSLGVVYGSGRTTPSGQDYYNLTVRPPARLSQGNVSLMFPLSIPAAITSAFGWRMHPVMGISRFHSGTDLGAPLGTPVLAAFSGKVAVADFMGGYGLTVVLQHQNGSEETLYAHLSEIFVKPGETVRQGETIGRVGSTGLSTGPHLHFEFRKRLPEGWVVMDAGGALEYALAQLVKSLQFAQSSPGKLALIRSTSFTKALQMVQTEAANAPESSSESMVELSNAAESDSVN